MRLVWAVRGRAGSSRLSSSEADGVWGGAPALEKIFGREIDSRRFSAPNTTPKNGLWGARNNALPPKTTALLPFCPPWGKLLCRHFGCFAGAGQVEKRFAGAQILALLDPPPGRGHLLPRQQEREGGAARARPAAVGEQARLRDRRCAPEEQGKEEEESESSLREQCEDLEAKLEEAQAKLAARQADE